MRILHAESAASQVHRLAGLFGALGLDSKLVSFANGRLAYLRSADLLADGLVIDAASLANEPGAADFVRQCISEGGKSQVLVLCTNSSGPTKSFVRAITMGQISGFCDSLGSTTCSFPSSARSTVRELAGAVFRISPSPAPYFVGQNLETLMRVGDNVTFARLKMDSGCSVFLWGAGEILDVAVPLDSELDFELAIDRFIPGIVFARTAAGRAVWHVPKALATVVIDDPLLQPFYGHIDFNELLRSARANQYFVTVAFIPWNFWRTKRRHISLFRSFEDVFETCVHGNDHSSGEFEINDYQTLRFRADQAIARMERHRDRTGVQYERVMVCPQERYSAAALEAIAATGKYKAVANSRLIPNVPEAKARISSKTLLQPATDSWSNVALIKRHYPHEGWEKLALELFIGRPAIVAEHHEYFSDGTARIERFSRKLRQVCPDLLWTSLGNSASTLHWRRQVDPETWRIRLFTDECVLEPASNGLVVYQVERRVYDNSTVTGVTANGRHVEYQTYKDWVRFDVESTGPVTLRVLREIDEPPSIPRPEFHEIAGVAVRRALSEFRDRILSKGVLKKSLVRQFR